MVIVFNSGLATKSRKHLCQSQSLCKKGVPVLYTPFICRALDHQYFEAKPRIKDKLILTKGGGAPCQSDYSNNIDCRHWLSDNQKAGDEKSSEEQKSTPFPRKQCNMGSMVCVVTYITYIQSAPNILPFGFYPNPSIFYVISVSFCMSALIKKH